MPTFGYEFNDEGAPERYLAPVGFPYGAAHESDVQYLFDLNNTPYPGILTQAQQQLATTMRQDWTTFAKNGSPSSPSGTVWTRFTDFHQDLRSLAPSSSRMESDFAAEHHCAFWARFA